MYKRLINKEDLLKQKDQDENSDAISISSLLSLDEVKPMKSHQAMIMLFLCKKRKDKKGINLKRAGLSKSKFSINLSNQENNRIRSKFLIQALHDTADIFGAHHEKIFARYLSDFEFNI